MDKIEYFMKKAIGEAKKSLIYEDVPVGAVITKGNKIIAKAYNQKEFKKDATMHAEIIAIKKACKKVQNFRLCDCEIYITKEPCLMCMGAILSARIKKIYFGASDKKFGTKDLASNNNFNHKSEIYGGICKEECEALLTNFFKNLRKTKCK